MSIYKELLKNKDLMESAISEEEEKKNTDFLSTGVISLNLLFSGKVDGGIAVGRLSQMCAPPSLGKSFVALSLIKNAQKKGMMCIMIDTEHAFNFEWAKTIGIDVSQEKLIVIQENMIEEVQRLVLSIVKSVPKEQRKNVFITIDSFGNLVTDKTLTDAQKGDDKRDMTVSTKKNNLARLLLGTKTTIFIVNHTYANTGGYGDPMAIPGGQVLYHNCGAIVLARSKAKETKSATDKEITGQVVTCRTFKSRYGKEHSTLKFRIKVSGGLDIFFGLLEDALEQGCIVKEGNKYTRPSIKDDKKYWEKEIYNVDFWLPLFKKTELKEWLQSKYSYAGEDLDIATIDFNEELNKDG